jgi:hypothetical protein
VSRECLFKRKLIKRCSGGGGGGGGGGFFYV